MGHNELRQRHFPRESGTNTFLPRGVKEVLPEGSYRLGPVRRSFTDGSYPGGLLKVSMHRNFRENFYWLI